MRASSSSPLRAERIALVATASTSSIPAARQNDPNTFAVRTARSIGSGFSVPSWPMPWPTRTASRISSTCCQ